MNTHQTALVGGWRSKVLGVNRPTITRRIPLTGAPRRGGAGASNAVATPNARTADAAEAIRRSPLGLDLPSNHPGLALVASSLVRTPSAATGGRASPITAPAHLRAPAARPPCARPPRALC